MGGGGIERGVAASFRGISTTLPASRVRCGTSPSQQPCEVGAVGSVSPLQTLRRGQVT